MERMLALHKELDAPNTATDKTPIQRQFDTTDRQIGELVYELYGLSTDDIRVVVDATKR